MKRYLSNVLVLNYITKLQKSKQYGTPIKANI